MAPPMACKVGIGLLLVSLVVSSVAQDTTHLGSPYGGTAATIPGEIEAEEFDYGGEGVGYSDSTVPNRQGDFRPEEAVDINALDGGGYNVGYITDGEYLRYSVDITEDVAAFDFSFLVASKYGTGSFRIVSGGKDCSHYTADLTGIVTVPFTGNWATYEYLTVSGGGHDGLDAGTAHIWFCVLSEGFNIDSFSMTGAVIGPYGGTAAKIPGPIEAEEFDYGGEGVGYSDSTPTNRQGDFRLDEAVDINSLDAGGYNVGYITSGEYLRYTVEVTEDVAAFDFSFLVASKHGTGSFHIVSGGTNCSNYDTDLTGIVAVPSTGNGAMYEYLTVSGGGHAGLVAGETYIWFCALSKGFNIDSFSMTGAVIGPYGGTATKIPGHIEAEEFDYGGEGVGYSDSTPTNRQGDFRLDEAVDINALDDGGYNVGYITSGEYLRYTVDVAEPVEAFDFSFRVASRLDASFHVVSGGNGCPDFDTDLSGIVTMASTGNGRKYEDIVVSGHGNGGLDAGLSYIWFCALSKNFNLDAFTITATELESGPYGGSATKIPGLIQAEQYDYGGQGVGYVDKTLTSNGGDFRPDDFVGIAPLGEGYKIGGLKDGESLRYTIDLTEAVDAFWFSFRLAVRSPGSFFVVSGSKGCQDYTTDLTGIVEAKTTGGLNDYDNLSVPGIGGLDVGVVQIWFCALADDFNLDYFSIRATESESGPYEGTAAQIPGLIQAEEYDYGGEGVGYVDKTARSTGGDFRPDDPVGTLAFDGGYEVGEFQKGESLRYTVDVTEDVDAFSINFRIAVKRTASFSVVSGPNGCDDYTTDLSGVVEASTTGGTNDYGLLSVSGIGGLDAGVAVIWFCAFSDDLNLDYFSLVVPSDDR